MNIIKYCPYFNNLKATDEDAFNLLNGYLRQNTPSGMSFIILSLIQKYWNFLITVKILQLNKKYHPNIHSPQLELGKATNTFNLGNCQFKFIVQIDSLSAHIYPFFGSYTITNNNSHEIINTIKDKRENEWKTTTKNIKIQFTIYKASACHNQCSKIKHGSHIKISIQDAEQGTNEGIIKILLNSHFDPNSMIKMIVWEGSKFRKEGHTMCTQCQCQNSSLFAMLTKGWIFID